MTWSDLESAGVLVDNMRGCVFGSCGASFFFRDGLPRLLKGKHKRATPRTQLPRVVQTPGRRVWGAQVD
jgi:hypothetical protein